MKSPYTTEDLTKLERFQRTLAGEPVDRPPVWMMRQAGRYLPEYRKVREKYDFLEMCRTPEAAAEVSIQPLEILDVDAVIVFNDILVPLEAMGIPVEFGGGGPELTAPLRSSEDLDRFRASNFDQQEPVFKTLSVLRDRIGPDVPLFGFAGAPFTMAAYAIEGKITKDLSIIKKLVYREPELIHNILSRLTETIANYLRIQGEAGVNMVQLFDSWAACLPLEYYEEFALRYQRKVIEMVRPLGIPVALYVNGSASVLEAMVESGADVLSVDWRLPLSQVRQRVGDQAILQGNLDPLLLFGDSKQVEAQTRKMIADAGTQTRYIANLGHGILPRTPVENARAFIQTVKGSPLECSE